MAPAPRCRKGAIHPITYCAGISRTSWPWEAPARYNRWSGKRWWCHGLKADLPPAPQHIGQGAVDRVALLLLATEHGDALAVLAQAGEHVAIFRFGLVLVL